MGKRGLKGRKGKTIRKWRKKVEKRIWRKWRNQRKGKIRYGQARGEGKRMGWREEKSDTDRLICL